MAQSQVWSPKHPAFQSLLTALASATTPVYIVGGVVRDYLLGGWRTHNDLDVVARHPVMEVARRVADDLGWAFYPLDTARDVARLVFTATATPLVCDIAAMRGGSIDSDLAARDFTINAMAVEWQGKRATQVLDLAGGRADLDARLLRRVTPSSLAEDPVRMLRAVRFAAQLGFTIEEETEQQILRMAETIRLTSAERIRDELWKIMQAPAPEAAIEQLRRYNLLRPVLPEVAAMEGITQSPPHTLDVYAHSLRTVAYIRQFRNWLLGEPQAESLTDSPIAVTPAVVLWQQQLEPWRFRLRQHFLQPMAADHMRVDWLTWFALLHDIGKPETRSLEETADGIRIRYLNHEAVGAEMAADRLNDLRFSRQEIMLAQSVIAHHMRPHLLHASFGSGRLSRRACYRFFRDSGGQTFDNFPGVDIVLLALSDYLATYNAPLPPNWEAYLAHACDLLEFAFHAEGMEQARTPLVDGHTLMRYFSLKPGPQIGDLLDRLQEAQAAGEVHDAEEALALAASWMLDRKD